MDAQGDAAAERFRNAERIFAAACDLPPWQRAEHVARACAGDAELAREVAALLAVAPDAEELFAKAPDPRIGDVVGRWRLKERIGAGGMGVVYRAERADGEFTQTVALKLLRATAESDEARGRFLRERQVLARLSHPGIARLIDGGTDDDGGLFLVMELVDGVHLDEWCDARRLPLRARLELFRSVCAAVEFAHRGLVVHRDLKPSNVLVTPDGAVKLLDFGIAKVLEPGAELERTLTRERRFTPDYASPEVVRGELATTSADVFSLGVILYELLTGKRPHEATTQTPAAIERAICETLPKPPSAALLTADAAAARATTVDGLRAALRGDLDAIVAVALAKEPERRYPSVERLSEDVARVLAGEPIAARRPGRGEALARWVRRNRALAATAAAALLLLVGGATATTVAWVAAARDADTAAKVNALLRSLLASPSLAAAASRDEALASQLANAARQLDDGLLQRDPRVEADLRSTLGERWDDLGRPADAARQWTRATTLLQKSLGEAAPETLRARIALARSTHESGGTPAAEKLLVDVIGRCQAARPESRELALAFLALGELRLDDEHGFDAVRELRNSQSLFERLTPGDPSDLAESERALGLGLSVTGGEVEAEPLLRRALATRRAEGVGARIAECLCALGVDLTHLGRYDEAERSLDEALALRRAVMEPDHPAVAEGLELRGRLFTEAARLADAETDLREALRILRGRSAGPATRRARVELDLADVLRRRGRDDEARPFVDSATTALTAAHLDESHPLLRRARDLAAKLKAPR